MRKALGLVAAVIVSLASLVLVPTSAQAAVPCSAYNRPVFTAVNPTTQASAVSYWATDLAIATRSGFTRYTGVLGTGAQNFQIGLWSMFRLTNATTHDVMWVNRSAERDALLKKGYVQGPRDFFATMTDDACVSPVYRLYKGSIHRYAGTVASRDALVSAGWRYEKVAFYLAPAPRTDTQFTFAVVPDTQQEVMRSEDQRAEQRAAWIVAQKPTMDLRFAVATGDLANWDTATHYQFAKISAAFKPLAAKVPFAPTPGNHDTAAVCPGGSACPGADTSVTVRDTTTYNRYWTESMFPALKGQYQSGKMDNSYQIVSAGGVSWLLLSLELWARPGAITWARNVVAANPRSNVVVVTHAYLGSEGEISLSNGGYGATSPKYLWDNLIKVYPNIKFVVSGHVGTATMRIDTGTKGNKIISYLGTFHSDTTNPTRYVEVDTKSGVATTRIYSSWDKTAQSNFNTQTSGMSFVKPLS